VSVQVDVANTGSLEGGEVVQLYLAYPLQAGEPPKVLRRFEKIHPKPGETHTVSFTLHERDVSIWDVSQHDWSLSYGMFVAFVGASSRDIRVMGTFNV